MTDPYPRVENHESPRRSFERASSNNLDNMTPSSATLQQTSGCYTLGAPARSECPDQSEAVSTTPRADAVSLPPPSGGPASLVLRGDRSEPLRPMKLAAVLAIAIGHLFAHTELTRCL